MVPPLAVRSPLQHPAPDTIAQPPKLRDRDQMVSASGVGWRTVVGAGGVVADARARGLGGELPLGRDQLRRQRRPDTRRQHRLLVRLTQQERIQQRPLACG